MPLYQYECQKCEKQSDIRHKYGATDVVCPECGSEDISRMLVGAPRIVKIGSNQPSSETRIKEALTDHKNDLKEQRKALSNKKHKERKGR